MEREIEEQENLQSDPLEPTVRGEEQDWTRANLAYQIL